MSVRVSRLCYPWILKRGGLESSGRILISSNGKTKRKTFFSSFFFVKKIYFLKIQIFKKEINDLLRCFENFGFLNNFDIFLDLWFFMFFFGFLDFSLRFFVISCIFYLIFFICLNIFKFTKVTTKSYGGYY